MRMPDGHNAKRYRWAKIVALSCAFLLATNAIWQAFGDPFDWARDAVVPESLSQGSDAKPAPIESIKINVNIPLGRPTESVNQVLLTVGKPYRIEVSGRYLWFAPNNTADAECSQYESIMDSTWQQNRLGAASPAFTGGVRTRQGSRLDDTKLDDFHADDPFDVYVNGNETNWQPVVDTGGGCNSTNNTYYADITAETTKLAFHIFDPFNNNSRACVLGSGGSCTSSSENFVARIYPGPKTLPEAGETLVESILVDPRNMKNPPEVKTLTELQRGRTYRFVASGTYTVNAYPGYVGDAECGIVDESGSQWTAHRWDYDGSDIKDDVGDVFVNGSEIEWTPRWDTNGKGCNVFDHTYYYVYQPAFTGKARFLLLGHHNLLNGGVIKIDIYTRTDPPTLPDPPPAVKDLPLQPAPTSTPPTWTGSNCSVGANGFVSVPCKVQVPANSRTGVSVPLAAGNYRLQSVGTYTWHAQPGNFSDAECAQWQVLPTANDPTWLGNRFGGLAPAFGGSPTDDPLDVYVAGRAVDWAPATDSGGGCNTADHIYNYVYSQSSSKAVNFKIYDPMNSNTLAKGELTIRIMPGPEPEAASNDLLVSTIVLNPRTSLSGNTGISLPKGKLHRIVATGTYKASGYELDAECSSRGSGGWLTGGFGPTEDTGDVLIDGISRQWIPLEDSGAGCNPSAHAYRFNLTPTRTAAVSFRLKLDPNLMYEGFIVIKVYAVGDGIRT